MLPEPPELGQTMAATILARVAEQAGDEGRNRQPVHLLHDHEQVPGKGRERKRSDTLQLEGCLGL